MKVNGALIKQLREHEPLTAEMLAERVGVSPQTIHRIEREGTARWSNIQRISVVLNVSMKKLVSEVKN